MFTTDENRLIESKFEELRLITLKRCANQEEYEVVLKAFELAKAAHNGVRRRSGGPYIIHPVEVAQIVVQEIGLGYKSIAAALLHDVVEDTDYTVEDIERLFGTKIASLVDGLTKIKSAIGNFTPDALNQNASLLEISDQAENFKRILLTLNDDIRVILIKLADRLHNMRTIEHLPDRKKAKILGETKFIFIPLAHKLGLYSIKSEFENIWLQNTLPEQYSLIETMVSQVADIKGVAMDEFIKSVDVILNDTGLNFTITKRTKTPYSIWEKMNRKSIPFEEIYDLYAIRIVFEPKQDEDEVTQCMRIYTLIAKHFKPKEGRIRDWVNNPKPNGYEALHCTVMGPGGNWIEIQIRTKRMNDIAERGVAAHWSYKTGSSLEGELDKWLGMVRVVLENPNLNAQAIIDQVSEILNPGIQIFTPKGDIRSVPRGATALDLAYLIHTEIGNKALAAKVNYKLVPLSYKLRNGDQVEIITAESQTPKREWLDFVNTSRARSMIIIALKSEAKENLKHGQSILDNKLKELDIQPSVSVYKKLNNHYKMVNKEELFSKVGAELINISDLSKIVKKGNTNILTKYWSIPFFKGSSKEGQEVDDSEEDRVESEKIDKKKDYMLKEDILEHTLSYSIATCCNPIPGDEVVGFMTDDGVVVHKKDCQTATSLAAKRGEKIVNAKWSKHTLLVFLARIGIKGIDRIGLLNDITQPITLDLNLNIRRIVVETNDGIFDGTIDLYVHDRDNLNDLIKTISKISGIERVARLDIKDE